MKMLNTTTAKLNETTIVLKKLKLKLVKNGVFNIYILMFGLDTF